MAIATINPATGHKVRDFESLSDSEVSAKVALSWSVFHEALKNPHILSDRRAMLIRVAGLLEKRVEDYAKLMTLEMGKPIQAARDETLKCAKNFHFYAEKGPSFLAPETLPLSDTQTAEIHYLPIGPVLAIMPWNFPFWQALRCAAPILLSGNSMLLKHASNVPQCALALEQLFHDAGLEHGAFQTLLIGSDQVEAIIADPQVQGVTLTGSEGAGRSVAASAGKHLKKSVLELGGSDPFIVFPSADVKKAAEVATTSRLINNGQSCIAAKRFIIHSSIYPEFRDEMIARFRALKVGDPMDASTQLGPLATSRIRLDLEELVDDATEKGAKATVGGKVIPGPGYFFEATILEDIPMGARIQQEEAFGPVASLYSFDDIDEAITCANGTHFGLGANVWTNEPSEMSRCLREVEAGCLFFNGMVASDPRVPFGGVKASGYGRELGLPGAREFTNVKTVVKMREGKQAQNPGD